MNRRTKAVTGAYTENRNRRLNMKNFEHYKRGYYMPPEKSVKWVEKEYIDKAPIWCSENILIRRRSSVEKKKETVFRH